MIITMVIHLLSHPPAYNKKIHPPNSGESPMIARWAAIPWKLNIALFIHGFSTDPGSVCQGVIHLITYSNNDNSC